MNLLSGYSPCCGFSGGGQTPPPNPSPQPPQKPSHKGGSGLLLVGLAAVAFWAFRRR